jgi:acylphosphatase
MKTFHLRITGKVQGVWYRASTKDKALSLGLKGKVWNEPDGAVGASVQGDENKIEEFIRWCHDGPPLANVDDIQVSEEMSTTIFASFDIVKM